MTSYYTEFHLSARRHSFGAEQVAHVNDTSQQMEIARNRRELGRMEFSVATGAGRVKIRSPSTFTVATPVHQLWVNSTVWPSAFQVSYAIAMSP